MGIQVNGNNDLISASDGSLSIDGLSVNSPSGIITAQKFVGKLVGDGSDITGISGFATALSNRKSTRLNSSH